MTKAPLVQIVESDDICKYCTGGEGKKPDCSNCYDHSDFKGKRLQSSIAMSCRCKHCRNRYWDGNGLTYGGEQRCKKTGKYIMVEMMRGITPQWCPLPPKIKRSAVR